jgi:hypothetical protein
MKLKSLNIRRSLGLASVLGAVLAIATAGCSGEVDSPEDPDDYPSPTPRGTTTTWNDSAQNDTLTPECSNSQGCSGDRGCAGSERCLPLCTTSSDDRQDGSVLGACALAR